MNQPNWNAERAARIAGATESERESARQDYIAYALRNRALGATPESFQVFLGDWLSAKRVSLPGGEEPEPYEARSYLDQYGGRDRKEQQI
jgi:hypothetical protein